MHDYSLRVYNIGQGLFSLFLGITDDNKPYVAIFDCGTTLNYNQETTILCIEEAVKLIQTYIRGYEGYVFSPTLKVNRLIIDLIVISHQDIDHWNLLLDIIYRLEFGEPECPNFGYAIGKESFFEKITSENGGEITSKNSYYTLEKREIKGLVEYAETTITKPGKFNDISIIARYTNYNNNSFLKKYSICYKLLKYQLNFIVNITIDLNNKIDSKDKIEIETIGIRVIRKGTKIEYIEINISISLTYTINNDGIYLNYSTLENTLVVAIYNKLKGYRDGYRRKIGDSEVEPTINSIQELINKKFSCYIQKHEPLEKTYYEKSNYKTPKICISNLWFC